ncbi:DUF5623 domain-containing protein [Sphingobacterium sp.]|uniref:DUF5623 domain-containing protein n=1 Tax=Sphingobacterium sp. TaxID=341027 RepID=UPI00289EF6AE|nr:DUF5623 domain-containing protein [Sphingobacterium sp.]
MTQKTKEGEVEKIKRNAKNIKKQMGIPHHQALDMSAIEQGYSNFRNFLNIFQPKEKDKRNKMEVPNSLPRPLTFPYKTLGSPNGARRPNAKVPVKIHQELGRVLKELYSALEFNKKGHKAVSIIKSTLDDWIQLEYTSKTELKDELYFTIYYGDTDYPSDPWPTDKRKMELEKLVEVCRKLLKNSYPSCSPIHSLNKRLDQVLKAIHNWPLNKQIKGLKEVKGQIAKGTLIYLKKNQRKPAILLSHDTVNNLIYCYEDAGPAVLSREEITVARDQSKVKKFHPMRLSLPYGKWFCENGAEVLFNRDYIPIWMKDKNGKVHQIDPDTNVVNVGNLVFYFNDGSTPWGGNQSTFVKCKNILLSWNVSNKTSLLLKALGDSVIKGNANNLKFRKRTNIFP